MIKHAALVAGMTVLLLAPAAVAGQDCKVDLCHLPPGNPENAHVISVSVDALDAHLAHGDGPAFEGFCYVFVPIPTLAADEVQLRTLADVATASRQPPIGSAFVVPNWSWCNQRRWDRVSPSCSPVIGKTCEPPVAVEITPGNKTQTSPESFMADFKTHVSFSSLLGVGYAAAGYLSCSSCHTSPRVCWPAGSAASRACCPTWTVTPASRVVSRSHFAAAVVPMLMYERFRQLDLSHEMIVLAAVTMYMSIRFLSAQDTHPLHRASRHVPQHSRDVKSPVAWPIWPACRAARRCDISRRAAS